MLKLTTYSIITILTIIFSKSIELSILKIGLPWTISKLIPHFILLVCGILLCTWFIKNLQIKNNFVKLSMLIIMLILPFGIGFYLNPIYDVDLKKEGKSFQQPPNLTELNATDLAIIAIPGCPFCHDAIYDLKILKERNPNMRIRFIIATEEKEEIKPYLAEIGNYFEVTTSPNINELYQLADGAFPTFVQVRNNQVKNIWSNDAFGVRTKDFLENQIAK